MAAAVQSEAASRMPRSRVERSQDVTTADGRRSRDDAEGRHDVRGGAANDGGSDGGVSSPRRSRELDPAFTRAFGRAARREKWSSQMEIETHAFRDARGRRRARHRLPARAARLPRAHALCALIQTGEENYFFWLQSVDEPTSRSSSPTRASSSRTTRSRSATRRRQSCSSTDIELRAGLRHLQQGGRVADRQPARPDRGQRREPPGQQVVLTEKKWTTRQPLMRLQAEVPLAKSA